MNHKRIKLEIPKSLLISIINTMDNGESLENYLNKLLLAGLKSEGKLP
jgi:hypothetical protein